MKFLKFLRLLLNEINKLSQILTTLKVTFDFAQQPYINGFSELFAQIWRDDGIGLRNAVRMGSLPGNIPVEIEAIFELA